MKTNPKLKAAVVSAPALAIKNASPQKAAPGDDGLTELQVWTMPAVNRRLLICHAPGADGSNPMTLVSVEVRDNINFLKAMRLRARRVKANQFALEGPCPRRKGKW